MNPKVTALLADILTLPEEDRIAIVDGIWISMSEPGKDELYEHDPYNDPEFRAEINRRLKESRDHPERLIDGDQFLAGLKVRYQKVVAT